MPLTPEAVRSLNDMNNPNATLDRLSPRDRMSTAKGVTPPTAPVKKTN